MFIYAFSDLFVILISVGVSTRFKQIFNELMEDKGQVLFESSFSTINYDIMYSLCRLNIGLTKGLRIVQCVNSYLKLMMP